MLDIHAILGRLASRKVAVWGCGMTGRGFIRVLADRHSLPVHLLVDSNPALTGKRIGNLAIGLPDTLPGSGERPFVFIAVAVKEQEIIDFLQARGYTRNEDFALLSELVPSFYTIDIVGACNLRCPSCPRGNYGSAPPAGLMKLEMFQRIVDKIVAESPLVTHIALYNWGDSLLHPQLPLFIEELNRRGIFSALSTNFSFSNPPIRELVKAQPGELKISCSGYFQETYGRTHRRGDIRLVKSNMYRLRYYMDKQKSDLSVKVEYHMYRHNIGADLERMAALCQELGFDFNPYIAHATPVEELIDFQAGRRNPILEELDQLLLVPIATGVEIAQPHRTGQCTYLNQTNINHDGSLSLCCVSFDPRRNTIHPDYLTASLADIEAAKQSHPLCGDCLELGIPQFLQGCDMQRRLEVAASRVDALPDILERMRGDH